MSRACCRWITQTSRTDSARIAAAVAEVCPNALYNQFDRKTTVRPIVVNHIYDDIPRLLSCFHVAMGFGNLLQRIASVDDGAQLPRLHQLCQESQVFHRRFVISKCTFLLPCLDVHLPRINWISPVGLAIR